MYRPVKTAFFILGPCVPLAQIVERDLRPELGGRQPFPRRRRTQIPQRPKAEPVSGNGAELPAHRLAQITPVGLLSGGHIESDGEDGREPPDGTREVGAVEDLFAPVALQVDGDPAPPRPPGQRPSERCARS